MTKIHKVKCDRCGCKRQMTKDRTFYNAYKLPKRWKNVKKTWFTDKDICPRCIKEIKGEVDKLFRK